MPYMNFASPLAMPLFLATTAAAQTTSWGYSGETGPQHWAQLDPEYAACNAGTQQSPVDITTATAIEAELPVLSINWNENVSLDVLRNGHTIQDNNADLGQAVIDGMVYTLRQFHFHMPSEHMIDGKTYPAEVHFVHAADDGSLAVIGGLLEGGGSNLLLEETIASAPTNKGTARIIATGDPRQLLPQDMAVYHYEGSLTTPPCSEIVNWNILQTPIQVGDAALTKLQGLIYNDARPTQPLNRRFMLK